MSVFGIQHQEQGQAAKAVVATVAGMLEQPVNQIANAKRGCDPVDGSPDS